MGLVKGQSGLRETHKNNGRSRRHGSGIEGTCRSYIGSRFGPWPPHSSSKPSELQLESSNFTFWPLRAPGMHMVHVHNMQPQLIKTHLKDEASHYSWLSKTAKHKTEKTYKITKHTQTVLSSGGSQPPETPGPRGLIPSGRLQQPTHRWQIHTDTQTRQEWWFSPLISLL